ncbi:dihydrofolate synthase/folylpolyglutamate synthase [Kordia periserrulae]|uniref:Dihydrofolate synthase/folylpolyglutamate synthase n=1 Tax=Kordia periserrulae TaxID=701523 RepID=A0A2T6BXX3_9FLAO|nr:folylpolyglutamate synthase/dihydrofolate synthase family protein [Kordia periserrulae]PTX60876.1 dihydrofolate synthase/folylpolyglutamate synthase [Kordia periserrulae]
MTRQEALAWLEAQYQASYQQKGASSKSKAWDLTNMTKFALHLGNPHEKFKSVHVAGTNGKGSTSHMIASILQEAGCKVGLFTSPHLKDFKERIHVNDHMIAKDATIAFVKQYKEIVDKLQLSFFELTVGMAFYHFALQNVDIAVVEVGLGGRLDATNIITPEVSVITNIGLDHVKILGDTLSKIAAEKAGIIKENIPVVVGEFHEETFPVFKEKAQQVNSKLYLAEKTIQKKYQTDLLGDYQQKNYKSAVQAVQLLNGFQITEIHIQNGLAKVVSNTNLQGRWQILSTTPKTICDTAHNKEGLELNMQQLQKESFETLHIVFGVVNDKNLSEIFSILPKDAIYYFCNPQLNRALPAHELQEVAATYHRIGNVYNSVSEAYSAAKKHATHADGIYIGGSNFVVAEIL